MQRTQRHGVDCARRECIRGSRSRGMEGLGLGDRVSEEGRCDILRGVRDIVRGEYKDTNWFQGILRAARRSHVSHRPRFWDEREFRELHMNLARNLGAHYLRSGSNQVRLPSVIM